MVASNNPIERGWTLVRELCKLAKCSDITAAIIELGLGSHDNQTPSFQLVESVDGWHRGGDETFIYPFDIIEAGGLRRSYILKACATFSPPSTLDDVVDKWVERRQLLKSKTIATPYLYAVGHGELLEEFIPHPINSQFVRTSIASRQTLLQQMVHYAGVLCGLGFAPVSAFSDLRSHGSDVIVVDFGQDLGPPGISANRDETLFTEALAQFERWDLSISSELESELYEWFLQAVNRCRT